MSYGLNTSDSSQEFLDSWFYYQRLVILLLYTVFSVLSSCISIKLKPNYCKYWNGTSGEKNLGVYFGRRVLKEFLDERISKKKRKFRGLYWIFPARLSRANYTGCWFYSLALSRPASVFCPVIEMMLDYGTLFCLSISTEFFLADCFVY